MEKMKIKLKSQQFNKNINHEKKKKLLTNIRDNV